MNSITRSLFLFVRKGTLPPLFCFHPIDGWIGQYQTISPFLDQNRPLFGIRARGLEPGEIPHQTIEEAVREYTDAIKTVQKEGPYHLLGFSAGALSAHALSCQFQSQGELVSYLGIIDASAPSPQKRLFNLSQGQGSNTIMVAGYHFLKNRLKTDNDNIFFSLFVKSISSLSQILLFFKGSNLLPVSRPHADNNFGSPKAGWISTLPEQQQSLVRTQRRAIELIPAPNIFGRYNPVFYRFGFGILSRRSHTGMECVHYRKNHHFRCSW